MHAYLIVGGQEENINKKVSEISAGYILQKFTIAKISDVSELSKITKLTLTQKTAFLIDNIHNASEEAQSAFLKNLEEPQSQLVYILTARQTQTVLNTIVSRCTLIELLTIRSNNDKYSALAKEFIDVDTGKRLEIISKITDRNDAQMFLESILVQISKILPENKALNLSESAFYTLENIKRNGNVNLQLTNFVSSTI